MRSGRICTSDARSRWRLWSLVAGAVLAVAWAGLLPGSAAAEGPDAIVDAEGCTANTLPANDDGSTALVPLGFPIDFFGTVYDSLHVNNNGNVTFDSRLSMYTPFNLTSTGRVIIAPFFADVDTRGSGSGVVTYGSATIDGRPAFCVNWVDVGYYSARSDKLNSFQLLLVDRSTSLESAFDIVFNYDKVQWETGSASGGTNGLGGSAARAGYSNGSTDSLELPGSAVNGAFLDGNLTSGLIHNSRTSVANPQVGRYVFEVRGGAAPPAGSLFGQVTDAGGAGLGGATVQACRDDGACRVTATSGGGGYSLSGLAVGEYELRAFSPSGRSDLVSSTLGPLPVAGVAIQQNIVLDDLRLPGDATLEPSNIGDSGVAMVYWRNPLDLRVPGCTGGTGSYELVRGSTVVASGTLMEDPAGSYHATVAALHPNTGYAEMRMTIGCPNPADDTALLFDIYIDPSGFVHTVDGTPIVGAAVTLLRSEDDSPDTGADGPYVVVPDGSAIMDPSNRTNPDLTDADGHFGWDVITGWYMVRVEAEGCVDPDDPDRAFVETEPMFIPPEVTDLDLRLDCGVELGTPNEQIDDLVEVVQSYQLRRGLERSLIVQLDSAQRHLDGDRVERACHSMGRFIDHVDRHSGHPDGLTEAQATELDAAAGDITATLEC